MKLHIKIHFAYHKVSFAIISNYFTTELHVKDNSTQILFSCFPLWKLG